jgi:multicomponent Na+:H+ antiporter subunit F
VTVLTAVALGLLSLAALLFMARLVLGPTLPDRVIALDGMLTVIVGGIIVSAARNRSGIALDTVLVVSLVAFVGTGVLARFIERRGG